MKLLFVFLIFISASVYAGEDCIFDESAYVKFITRYSTENSDARVNLKTQTLTVNKNNEELIIEGGGCVHLGMAIELRTQKNYTEAQFLQRTLELTIEFGDWLINTGALKDSIEKGNYQNIDGTYFIEVDAMTVFNASYDPQGIISIDFYIN